MYMYIGVTILVVILSLFVKKEKLVERRRLEQKISRREFSNYFLLLLIGCALIFVSAGRIAVGNDYWAYREGFSLIAQNRHVSYEIGFNAVVWCIIQIFGQDQYIPIFAFFSIVTLFFFLKGIWDQSQWFLGSAFLFLTGGYFFLSMNSIRYYLALAICLYSLKYLFRLEYFKFIIIIILAALFHKTVLIVLPFFLLAHYCAKRKVPIWFYVVGAGCLISSILFRDFFELIIYKIYPFYEGLESNTIGVSYTNLGKCLAVFAIVLLCRKDVLKNNIENKCYLYINMIAVCIYTFGSFIPEASRLGYYFMATQIVFLPNILVQIQNKKLRYFFISAAGICYLAYFILFLNQADQDGIRLLPYFNWILGD